MSSSAYQSIDNNNNNNSIEGSSTPILYRDEYNSFIRWFHQFRALFTKNRSIFLRSKLSTLFVIITPAIFASILVIVAISLSEDVNLGNTEEFIVPFQKCKILDINEKISNDNSEKCISIMYSPNISPYNGVMKNVAKRLNLEYNIDIIGYDNNNDDLINSVTNKMGFLNTVILFNEMNNKFTYDIVYNNTGVFSYGYVPTVDYNGYNTVNIPTELFDLQNNIDQALIENSLIINSNIKHRTRFRMFDTTPMKIDQFDYSSNSNSNFDLVDNVSPRDRAASIGGLYNFVTGITISTLFFIHMIAREKQGKLLGAMRIMGMSESVYWFTWFTSAVIVNTISTLIVLAIVYAGDFSVFKYANFFVHFFTLWFFMCSMSSLALCLSSFVTQLKWVNVACFMLFVLSIVLTSTLGFIADQLYAPDASRPLLYFFSLMPWFHYSKIWMDILRGTERQKVTIDGITKFVQNHYKWSDMSHKKYIQCSEANCCLSNPNECYYVPSTNFSIGLLTTLICIYIFLAWYLGQVFSAQGSRRRFWFIFDPKYWGFKSSHENTVQGDTVEEVRVKSEEEQSIRTHKLSKSFKNVTAVKELSLTIQKGSCLALLGHNGAGKTTTMNILSGLLEPTYGHAYVLGMAITRNTARIQAMMGQVPQDNILWPQLTCYEHVQLYARLRHVPRNDEDNMIIDALNTVDLVKSSDTPSGALSGGMQRRLCLACAIVGDPSILFLDEATTGMDPVNKHGVWRAIRRLKSNRIVLLTTHSMEEADFLGDQIAMMSGGKLRATGTSLFLKNHFGSGYQLNLLTNPKPENIVQILKQIKELLPSAEVIDSAAGNITIGLPRKSLPSLPSFFRYIDEANKREKKRRPSNEYKKEQNKEEKEEEEEGYLREWSISNSTLEEVFLRLCSSEKNVNEVAIDFQALESENQIRLCEICGKRESQTVTLFTNYGLGLKVANIICSECAEKPYDPSKDKEEMKHILQQLETNQEQQLQQHHHHDHHHEEQKYEQGEKDEKEDDKEESKLLLSNNIQDKTNIFNSLGRPSSLVQIKAVMMKNGALLSKTRKANCCRVVLLILGVLSVWLSSSKPPSNVCPQGWSSSGMNKMACDTTNIKKEVSTFFDSAISDGLWLNGTTNSWLEPCIEQHLNGNVDQHTFYREPQSGLGWGYNKDNQVIPPQYWIEESATNFKLTNSLDLLNLGVGVLTDNCTATFTEFSSNTDLFTTVYKSSEEYREHISLPPQMCKESNGNQWYWSDHRGWWIDSITEAQNLAMKLFPTMGVKINDGKLDTNNIIELDYTLLFYNYAVDMNLVPQFPYVYDGLNSNCSFQVSPYTYISANEQQTFGAQFINAINNAIIRTLKNESNDPSSLQYISTRYVASLNLDYPQQVADGSIYQALTWTTFITMMFLPVVVARLVQERSDKLLHMMRISGLDLMSYYMGNFIFDFLLIFLWIILYVLMAIFFGARVFTTLNWSLLFSFCILWTYGQLGLSVFIASIISRTGVASIAGYVLLVVMTVVVPILFQFLPSHSYTAPIMLLPPISYARSAGLMFKNGNGPISDDLSFALGFLFLSGSLFLFVGLYILMSLHHSSIFWILSYISKSKTKHEKENQSNNDIQLNDKPVYGSIDHPLLIHDNDDDKDIILDEDVKVEKQRIEKLLSSNKPMLPVTVHRLKKTYNVGADNEKRAVQGVSFGVELGEVFGLLGPNGAGKSTSISVINGLEKATSGEAFVCGYSCTNQLKDVHSVLGVCPQFDCVWNDLSVQEHLYFYGRLKGVPKTHERALVQKLSEMVELDGDAFNQKASELSGGLRRRLSIAISLIGNPKVWLLDEPSTGLSPEARRQIWNIVNKQKKIGRAVILTTHSMEEADTLCSRIGIMANGKLECIGTQSHLKRRFGEGYRLSFNCTRDCGQVANLPDNKPSAESVGLRFLWTLREYVQINLASELKFSNAFGKVINFVLPNVGTGAVELFTLLAKFAPEKR